MSRSRSNSWAALAALCLAFVMIMIDSTIVNVALPSISDHFGAAFDRVMWVLNAYILVFTVLLITMGRLGDIYGQRNLYFVGLVLFVVGSVLCGVARDINWLIGARVIEGIGGATLMPQTMAIITAVFAPERRGAAFGVWGGVGAISVLLGVALGGVIVTGLGWQWAFYINVPIGVLALLAAWLFVPDLRLSLQHKLDWVGVLLASLGFLGIVFGVTEGQRYGWGAISGWITVPLVIIVGAVLLVVFMIWERYQDEPLVPLQLFRNRNFSLMNAVMILASFDLVGMLLLLSLYFQSVLGMSAMEAGIAMAPVSFVPIVISPIAGVVADRIGGKYIVALGALLFAVGMAMFGMAASPTATGADFALPLLVTGLGQGCVFAPLAAVAMQRVSPAVFGSASGVLNLTRQIGALIGGAGIAAVLQSQVVVNLRSQSMTAATQLPQDARQTFLDAINSTIAAGVQLGTAQNVSIQLPSGLSPELSERFSRVFQQVFAGAFTDALKVSLGVVVALLLIAAISCLPVERLRKEEEVELSMPVEEMG
mgnify:FL=1